MSASGVESRHDADWLSLPSLTHTGRPPFYIVASARDDRDARKEQSIRENAMKTNYKVAIALVAGAAIGGAAIQGLHAQAKPPTYAVIDISSITDPEGFKALGPKAGPANAAFGGKFIMRSDNITASDGTAPKRFVVIAFDSLEKAKAWTASTAQKEVDAIRAKTTKSRVFYVEGM
jgi:uncharacterized protein (DUF1330 family)